MSIQITNKTTATVTTTTVALNVYLSTNTAVTANTVVKFDTTIIDTNAAYSAATGLFTAPKTGQYLVTGGALATGSAGALYVTVNGSAANYINPSNTTNVGGGAAIVSASAGDTIGLFTDSSNTLVGGGAPYDTFMCIAFLGPVATGGGSGTSAYWSGYMPVGAQWSTTSASFADPTNLVGGNTLTQRVASGITVTAASGTTPGITFTPTSGGVYQITATSQIFNDTLSNDCDIRLFDGTTELTTAAMQGVTGAVVTPVTLVGFYVPGVTTPVTVKIQIAASSGVGTAFLGFAILAKSIEWSIKQL